jgi:HD-GYP domain-containing protein (c-di-GMP phosphodiesterase class II)
MADTRVAADFTTLNDRPCGRDLNLAAKSSPLQSSRVGAVEADRLRLAELASALSLATDLGMGQPLEHGLRTAIVAVRLAGRLGLDQRDLESVYYVSLLRFAGCTAESHLDAELFGDEIAARTELTRMMFASPGELLVTALRNVRPGEPLVRRGAAAAKALPRLRGAFNVSAVGHCEVTEVFARRIGLRHEVVAAVARLYERWDGHGFPGHARGEDVPLAVRVMQVAQDADRQRGLGGVAQAATVVRKRAGSAFDPAVAQAFAADADELLAGLDAPSVWDEALAAEPGSGPVFEGEAIDDVLRIIGEVADLKCPDTLGHSAAVAQLASAAGAEAGLAQDGVRLLHRAGHVHDVGRVAVSAAVWNKQGPLTPDELEQVRLHPYFTERVLARPRLLHELGRLGALHHERLDGSGYPRGVHARELPPTARILAAADAYRRLTEARPHRPAWSPQAAAERLEDEARQGRLDAEAVAAVLAAAGHEIGPLQAPRPAGLSDREAEVLRLLARGLVTKQVARRLGISVKTADNHIQHIYAKIGVSTRAGATIFAMEHGLVGVAA